MAIACVIAGTGLLHVADAGWAHAISVACLIGFVVVGFGAITTLATRTGGHSHVADPWSHQRPPLVRISACTARLNSQSNYLRKEPAIMSSDLATSNVDREMTVEEQIAHLRELFADAPEVGKKAFDNVFKDLTAQASETPPPPVVSAGRAGIRLGKVSELTIIIPLAPGGAERTRAFLRLLNGNLAGADDVGSVHDMRFVFLDNDTKMLFATAYDGDWDTYIDDFATKIPDYLDIIDSAWEGWPGIRSPHAKDYLAKHQVTAEGWFVANDLTVAETRRLKRIGQAVDEFLDKVGD